MKTFKLIDKTSKLMLKCWVMPNQQIRLMSTSSGHGPEDPSLFGRFKRGVESLGWKYSGPSPGAITGDDEGGMPTNSASFKYESEPRHSQDKRTTGKCVVAFGTKYFEMPGIKLLKIPLEVSLSGAGEGTHLSQEQRDGSKYKFTGNMGVKGKLQLTKEIPFFSPCVVLAPGMEVLNLRTGKGSKLEASIGDFSLPTLTLTDSSKLPIMERYESEKSRCVELITANRQGNMELIGEALVIHGVSPITGEGTDEVVLGEELDDTLNVKPGLQGGLVERNAKKGEIGEQFTIPLTLEQAYGVESPSVGQKTERLVMRITQRVQLTTEQVLYGEHGKGGRLAPKDGGTQEKIKVETVGKEVPKGGELEVGGEKSISPEKEKTGKKVEEGSLELGSDSSGTVRQSMGNSSKGSKQGPGLEKGTSVRNNVQIDPESQKSSTGPKIGGM